MNLIIHRTRKIAVHLGREVRMADVYKKKNGGFVYWSPFTGQRVLVKLKGQPSSLVSGKTQIKPANHAKGGRKMWIAAYVKALEARLESQHRCPERPSRTAKA